jgi:hypothetical protein
VKSPQKFSVLNWNFDESLKLFQNKKKILNTHFLLFFVCLFLVTVGFELRTSCLLGRRSCGLSHSASTTWFCFLSQQACCSTVFFYLGRREETQYRILWVIHKSLFLPTSDLNQVPLIISARHMSHLTSAFPQAPSHQVISSTVLF